MQLPMMDYDRQNVIPLAAWPSEPACLLGRVLVDRDLLSLLSAGLPGHQACYRVQNASSHQNMRPLACAAVARWPH